MSDLNDRSAPTDAEAFLAAQVLMRYAEVLGVPILQMGGLDHVVVVARGPITTRKLLALCAALES
jgi:hypothetical protein